MKHSSTKYRQISQILLAWFCEHARDLPWRKDYTPYAVWISEVMLQQTQMQRGVSYFLRWMERFPSVYDVASAREEDVLRAWEGLGYYSRAKNIRRAAQKIVNEMHGEFPNTAEQLRTLPGIGAYTAASIASIAFHEPVVCVDANVQRVISRLFDIEADVASEEGKKAISDFSRALLLDNDPRTFNQALMEFGALLCGKNPACKLCPCRNLCEAYANATVAVRPCKKRLARSNRMDVGCGLIVCESSLLVHRRPEKGIWASLTTLPSVEHFEGKKGSDLCAFFQDILEAPLRLGVFSCDINHSYTTWKIHLFAYELRCDKKVCVQEPYHWENLSAIGRVPLPSAHRKIVDRFVSMPSLFS